VKDAAAAHDARRQRQGIAPTGQYDPALLVNIGTNRWSFKPEIGFTRHGRSDDARCVCRRLVFHRQRQFLCQRSWSAAEHQDAGSDRRLRVSTSATTSGPRLWISADINYWRGGKTSVNGLRNNSTLQANSRYGVTGSAAR
jgi:hypothetical protein